MTHPNTLSDDEVLEAIDEALAAGDRDTLQGGIAVATLAHRLAYSPSTIRQHCRRLAATGEIVRVAGADPATGQPRPSFLPSDHPDASRSSHL